MPVFVFTERAGSVIDCQFVDEHLVDEIRKHVAINHPDLTIRVRDSLTECGE